MNLLSLIIIFLAIAICVSVAYIAWELTAVEPPQGHDEDKTASQEQRVETRQQEEKRPPQQQ